MTATISRVRALARRDLTLELSYHFQLFISLVSTLMSIVMFFFLSRLIGSPDELAAYRGGYFDFVLVGLVVMGFSQACVNSFGRSIQSAQGDGTLEILLSTSTRLPVLLTGTLVVPILFACFDAALYLGIGSTVSQLRFTVEGTAVAVLLLLLTLGTFAAIGLFSATVIILTKRGDPFSSLVLQGSNLLAGAMFPVTVLPDSWQVVSRMVPAFYGLRGVREVLLAGGGISEVRTDLLALTAFNLVLLPLGMWSLSRALRLAKRIGTLGNR